MQKVGKIISEARRKQNLSIKELSERTKIRPHVIEALEADDFSIMPEVYIKSFLKTLSQVLRVDLSKVQVQPTSEPTTASVKPISSDVTIKSEINEPSPEPPKVRNQSTVPKEVADFAQIFKKKNIQKRDKKAIYNYVFISALVVIVGLAVYFTISALTSGGKVRTDSSFIGGADTAVISEEKATNLFTYFEKPDSLILTAKAKDSAWIRLLIDGKQIIEILMKPGAEERWSASKYFVLDQGNSGAVQFYRNNEPLPIFGKPGTVVKNIRITMNEIVNPLEFRDTTLTQRTQRKKPADTAEKKPKVIEQSTIETDRGLFNRGQDDSAPN